MYVIGCYSYKGGSCRTTSAANIACALARNNKNVCIIDMDVEAGGMSVVLGVPPDEINERIFIQDYLNNPNIDYRNLVLDLNNFENEFNWSSLPANKFFIPARVAVQEEAIIEIDDPDILEIAFRKLIESIRDDEELSVDYLLIDSSNGYGDYSWMTLAIPNLILTFFRFSKQHIFGTLEVANFYADLEKKGALINNEYCATAVPKFLYEKGPHYQDFLDIRKTLEDEFGKKIFEIIPENDELKWDEKPFIGYTTNQDVNEIVDIFDEIAGKIIDIAENGGP